MSKIDRRRKYILVVDIETANQTEEALAYDIGLAVADKHGKIYETRSFVISELFFDNKELMQSAYYADKLPQYYQDIRDKKRTVVGIMNAYYSVRSLMAKYRIVDVYAYNANFDRNGLNRTLRYVTKSEYRYFFPKGTNIHCIWNMACQTIFKQKCFYRFAIDNKLYNDKTRNVSTSAETAFAYISGQADFTENHTGLEDVLIETAILAKCYRQHRKMATDIKRNCWMIPQKEFKKALDIRLQI